MARPDRRDVNHVETRGEDTSRVSLSPRVITGLVVAGLAATTNAQVFALLLSPIAGDLGISVSRLGALRTLEEAVAIATSLALTPIIDRYPRRNLLLTGFVLMATASLLAAAGLHPAMLVGYFVIDGVSKIFLFASILALPSDLTSGPALNRLLGFVIGSFALTGFTTVPMAGFLADELSWRSGFGLAAGIALAAFVVAIATLPDVRPAAHDHPSAADQFRAIAALPGLLPGLLSAMFRFAMYASVINYTSAFFVDDFGIDVSVAGLYFSIGSLGFLGASVISGYLLVRVGGTRALIGGGLVAGILAAVAFGAGLPLAVTGLALFVVASLMGILENASTALLFRLAPDHRGAAMSLNELVAAGGSMLGIGVGALALRFAGYGGIGVVLGLSAAIAIITTWIAVKAEHHSHPSRPATTPVARADDSLPSQC